MPRINSLFALIHKVSNVLNENKKSHFHKSDLNSQLVVPRSRSSKYLLLDLIQLVDSKSISKPNPEIIKSDT